MCATFVFTWPCTNALTCTIAQGCWCITVVSYSSLVPRPSTPPVFWSLAVCKNGGRTLGNFITWSAAQPSYVVTPPFNSQVMHETDLTFCASYEDGAESYTERMKHTQAKSHDSKRLQSDKREKTQQWCNYLMERKDGTIWSCTAYIIAISQWLSFEPGYVLQVRITSPLELVLFL